MPADTKEEGLLRDPGAWCREGTEVLSHTSLGIAEQLFWLGDLEQMAMSPGLGLPICAMEKITVHLTGGVGQLISDVCQQVFKMVPGPSKCSVNGT